MMRRVKFACDEPVLYESMNKEEEFDVVLDGTVSTVCKRTKDAIRAVSLSPIFLRVDAARRLTRARAKRINEKNKN